MRLPAALVVLLVLTGGVRAEEPPQSAIVCEDLVSLRRLMAEAPDRQATRQHLSEYPACRAVPAKEVGEVERRAMIGGAPFECVRIGQSGCAWLLP